MRNLARHLATVSSSLLGVWFLIVAYGPLHNIWADYQDGATSTYLMIGLPLVFTGLACFGAAIAVFRWR